MKMSGNTATCRMECTKDPKMTADVDMTFAGDGFTMKQDIAMDQGGQVMKMNQTMTGSYTGPLHGQEVISRSPAVASLAAAALAASAQQPAPAPSFKGKVKPGLYESEDRRGHGQHARHAADQKKQSHTRQQCLTDADVDKLAEESNPGLQDHRLQDDGHRRQLQGRPAPATPR